MISEVVTVAKINLKKGESLGSIGDKDYFGKINSYQQSQDMKALPVGIACKANLKTTINKREFITYQDVELDSDSFVVKLREIQDNQYHNQIQEK